MALVLKRNGRRSSLGALFISNPRKRKNAPKKRKNAPKRRKNTRKRNPSKTKRNALAIKRRKNAAIKRRKNALALKIRKNALALKRRKNGTKKGMRRRSARRAYKKNGTRKGMMRSTARKAYRKNGTRKGMRRRSARRAYMKNPSVGMLKPVEKFMSKIPILKMATPFLGATVIGAAVILPYNWAYKRISDYVQQSTMPSWVKSTDRYGGLALSGWLVAGLTGWGLKETKLVSATTAKYSAMGIAILAGGAQMLRWWEMHQAGELKLPFLSANKKTTESKDAGALAYFADGMAYDVVPMYSDASAMDATVSGHDLSSQEKAAAKMGMGAWSSAFGQCPYKSSSMDGTSRYAGKHGHRWGWLIKVLGWTRFAQLVQLDSPQRIKAISKIKIAAINAAQSEFDQGSKNGYGALALQMGALAYDSDSLSGLAMIGATH